MMFRQILGKFWLFGPITGLLLALVVTTVFTILDVVRNYGEVFRDSSGIKWPFVYETALSWFLPTFLHGLLIASIGHLLFTGLSALYRRYVTKRSDQSRS